MRNSFDSQKTTIFFVPDKIRSFKRITSSVILGESIGLVLSSAKDAQLQINLNRARIFNKRVRSIWVRFFLATSFANCSIVSACNFCWVVDNSRWMGVSIFSGRS